MSSEASVLSQYLLHRHPQVLHLVRPCHQARTVHPCTAVHEHHPTHSLPLPMHCLVQLLEEGIKPIHVEEGGDELCGG